MATPPEPADVDRVEEPKRPKITPIFVTDEPLRERRVPTARDEFGRPVEHVDAESDAAATHWDARNWRRD